MEVCSIGSPTMPLVVFIFTLLIAFPASVVQSQNTNKELPSPTSSSGSRPSKSPNLTKTSPPLPPQNKWPPPPKTPPKQPSSPKNSPPPPPSCRRSGPRQSSLHPCSAPKTHPPPPPAAVTPSSSVPAPPPRKVKIRPPAPSPTGLNLGKRVGLLFAGIAVILQVVVAGFLVYKKKQLYKVRD